MRWFFIRIETEVYQTSVMETLFLHLRFAICGIRGHMISSLSMKIQHYDWTKEEREYFWTSNRKENNSTTSLDSKQAWMNTRKRNSDKHCWDFTRITSSDARFTACAFHIVEWKHLNIAFHLVKNCHGNATGDTPVAQYTFYWAMWTCQLTHWLTPADISL